MTLLKSSRSLKLLTTLTFGATLISTSDALAKEEEKKNYNKTMMERVMVIGDQQNTKNISGSANFVNQEALDNYSYKDINRVLKQVPGVNVQEEDGFGLRPNIGLRGGRSNRSADLTLMEDGVLIAPAPYASPEAYYFPRIGKMEAIEVRKGSSTIEFGPRTTSGALNLITRQTPEKKTLGATAAYGSFDTNIFNLYYGDKVNNFSYLIDLSHEKSGGFKKIDAVGGDTGYSIQDVMAKVKYNTDETADIYQSIELKLGYTQEDSNETYLGTTDSDFWNDPNRRYSATQLDNMQNDHQQYQLRHFADFDNFDLTTTIYRNDFSRNWYKLNNLNTTTSSLNQNNLKVRANNRDYYSQGLQSVMASKFNTGDLEHNLKLSARYHEDSEDRFQRDDTYNLVNGVMNQSSTGVEGGAGNRELKASASAFYISNAIKYNKLTVTPGVRYENIRLERFDRNDPSTNNVNDLDVITPGIGANYQINDDLATFAGAHKGFAPPAPGNENAKTEESINYELGFRLNKNSLKSSVTGFFNDYSNLLGECNASSGNGSCQFGDQFNGGKVDVKGVEFELTYDLLDNFDSDQFKLPFTFNYTYTDARFKNSFKSEFSEWSTVAKGDQLPYIAKNQFFVGLGLVGKKWELHANAKYVGDMRSVAGSGTIAQSEKINNHFVVDLASEVEIYKNTRLFFNVDNLFDETYMASRSTNGARAGKPLSFLAGIKYEF